MTKLARAITEVIVFEFGPQEFLQKLSDPFFFQSLGCVLGFDWHSSGVTTTVTGALKEALRGTEHDLGIFVCGGKGRASRKTPFEIEEYAAGHSLPLSIGKKLVYASKMAAKVDNTALQDGYQLYHHTFIFIKPLKTVDSGSVSLSNGTRQSVCSSFKKPSAHGVETFASAPPASSEPHDTSPALGLTDFDWTVIQQGMNPENHMARRYHWLGSKVYDFVEEPESAICCDRKENRVLNLVDKESRGVRETSVEVVNQRVNCLLKDAEKLDILELPQRHFLYPADFNTKRLKKIFLQINEQQPQNFECLLGTKGVGPKTIRALSLISELIYGKKPSYKDPARYSFSHGGKDGVPYPIDRTTYDQSIKFLTEAVNKAKIDNSDKLQALRRLQPR